VLPAFCSSDTFDLIASFMERSNGPLGGPKHQASRPAPVDQMGVHLVLTPSDRSSFLDRAPDKVLDQLGVPQGASVGARVRGALIAANWSSVLANYASAEVLLEGQLAELLAKPYSPILELPSLGEIASALAGYESACEHPGWPGSAAFHICGRVKGLIVRRIPGYHDGPWTGYQRVASEAVELRQAIAC